MSRALPVRPSLLRRLLPWAALLGLLAFAGAPAATGPDTAVAAPALKNLGVAISPDHDLYAEGGLVAFAVDEHQAGQDFSGDGQLDDDVVGIFDIASGRVQITEHPARGAAHRWACRAGGYLAFISREDGQQDHNQDGDRTDAALALLDLSSRDVEFARVGAGQGVACSEGHVAYTASERDWGSGQDLNGDGDAEDSIWAIHDLANRDSYVLEIGPVAAIHASAKIDEERFLFTVHEPSNARDFNGDGDQQDIVTMSYDYRSRAIWNYELAAYLLPDERDHETRAAGRFVPVIAPEDDQGAGADHNHDGDTTDRVVFILDTRTGDLKSTERAGFALRSATEWLPIFVDEAAQGGTDLTGDGDASDHVLVFFNPLTGEEWNTQLAVTGSPSVPPRLASDFGSGMSARLVAAEISEGDSGVDLNNNGFTGDRLVLTFDPDHQRITDTNARSTCVFTRAELLSLGPAHALTCERESSYPPQDLNGDGDTLDRVAGLARLDGLAETSSGVAMDMSSRPRMTEDFGAFVASESGQGQDLNGDGDAYDRVLHLLDPSSGAATNAGISVARTGGPGTWRFVWAEDQGVLFVGASESSDGRDYNRDGDQGDVVLFAGP